MDIKKHPSNNSKLIVELTPNELEYLELEIGLHRPPANSALYFHFAHEAYVEIDIEMLPYLMSEIEIEYQDKITLCRLYELFKTELLNNKALREHYEQVN